MGWTQPGGSTAVFPFEMVLYTTGGGGINCKVPTQNNQLFPVEKVPR